MPEASFPLDPPSTVWINPNGTPTMAFWELMRKIHQSLGGDDAGDIRWDDFVVPITQGKQGNVGKPDFDYTNIGYLFPKNKTSEILYMVAQLPHAWVENGDIYPHVHLVQDADVAYTMKIDYKWFNPVGDAIPGSWTTYAMADQAAASHRSMDLDLQYPPFC
jgi:hypothetical protein